MLFKPDFLSAFDTPSAKKLTGDELLEEVMPLLLSAEYAYGEGEEEGIAVKGEGSDVVAARVELAAKMDHLGSVNLRLRQIIGDDDGGLGIPVFGEDIEEQLEDIQRKVSSLNQEIRFLVSQVRMLRRTPRV